MGSEEYCVFKRNCLCGRKDMFLVHCRRSDRNRKGAEYSGEILCGVCAKKYRFIWQGKYLDLVRQKDVLQRIKKEKEFLKYERDLMKSPEVLKLLQSFQDLIESKGDVSKRVKFIKSVTLLDQDDCFSAAKGGIHKHMMVRDLEVIMKIVVMKDSVILRKLKERQNLWKEVTNPLPKVGGWNYVIKN
jgi:hypothetical protein